MSDMNDALYAMRDLGISLPESGDAGEDQIRSELARELASRRPLRHRRIRLPFVGRTVALIPALMGVTVATAAAAVGASALLQSGPVAVFRHNAQPVGPVGSAPELVIPASAHVIDRFTIPGVGSVQYWVANTEQHGLCQAFARADGTWPGNAAHSPTARFVGDCRPTREQIVHRRWTAPQLRTSQGCCRCPWTSNRSRSRERIGAGGSSTTEWSAPTAPSP